MDGVDAACDGLVRGLYVNRAAFGEVVEPDCRACRRYGGSAGTLPTTSGSGASSLSTSRCRCRSSATSDRGCWASMRKCCNRSCGGQHGERESPVLDPRPSLRTVGPRGSSGCTTRMALGWCSSAESSSSRPESFSLCQARARRALLWSEAATKGGRVADWGERARSGLARLAGLLGPP